MDKEEEKERQMKRFKTLMLVIGAFAALFPLYQCAHTFTKF